MKYGLAYGNLPGEMLGEKREKPSALSSSVDRTERNINKANYFLI